MQPNLNMIAPAKSPSDSRKRVRYDEIPATPEMGAKLPKSSKEQRSPDASDVPELSLYRMKGKTDATDATGPLLHSDIPLALPSCLKATTCTTPDDRETGQVDDPWQKAPDDEDIFETLCRQAEQTAVENGREQPVSVHEVNAEWARMTMYRQPFAPSNNKRSISWSKKLHVTHIYFDVVDTEYECHEWLKNELKKSQIEKKKLRQQVIEALEIQIDLTEKLREKDKRAFEIV